MKRLLRNAEEEAVERNFVVHHKDMENAMLKVRPSAMRSIHLDVPEVRWEDIGGQREVKERLKEIVEWPLKYPEVRMTASYCFMIMMINI